MKPVLLVLCVVPSAETRLRLSESVESAGHRLLHAAGADQAQILLINGLDPDLIIFEASLLTPANSDFLDTVQAARSSMVCLICERGELNFKSRASELEVAFVLESPLVAAALAAMLDHVTKMGSSKAKSKVECTAIAKASFPFLTNPAFILEELESGRYFLAASVSMQQIYRQVQLLADVDAPVLILGESGTGKEIIAHLIHKHSRRSKHRFINVNCAALPAELLESELFGYQQGAFTGAIKDKPGKFEQANGGSLLLDEIGEMSAQMQAKLLHVLHDGQFCRLGARESSRADVRILAATNVEVESALVGKTFREDLYYRLNVFTINVPPLRERREEIPYLIEEIIRRLPEELRNGNDYIFSSQLMDAVLRYDWRGNVRELRNFVTRTMTMRDRDAAVHELETKIASGCRVEREEPMPRRLGQAKTGMRSIVRDLTDRAEETLIRDALEVSGWNRRHAAKYLNISYRGLLYKIQQHRLEPKSRAMVRPL